jgi:hypothetical protein
MKWSIGMRRISIGHGVIRKIKLRFSELGRIFFFISEARKPTISRNQMIKHG